MEIKDYVVLELSNEPNNNGMVFSKDCKVSFSENMKIYNNFDTFSEPLGEIISIKQVGKTIVADMDIKLPEIHKLLEEKKIFARIGCRVNIPEYDDYETNIKMPLEDITIDMIGLTEYPTNPGKGEE